MARYQATVTSPRPVDEVFDYLADFRSAAEWDPSVAESVHINGDEPIKVGAIFRVTTKTAMSKVVLEYTTTELERPQRIGLRGENATMVALDTITIEPATDGGSTVTYAADIQLKGVLKLADPLLELGFQRLGNQARDSLAKKLNEV